MAVGSILKCDNCGESYDSGASGHYVCDPWRVEAHKAMLFIESQGYGHMARYFDRDEVVQFLINYKNENKS